MNQFKKWISPVLLTIGFLAGSIVLLNKNGINLENSVARVLSLEPFWIVILLGLACIQMTLQAARLHVLSQSVLSLRFGDVLRIYSIGQGLNAVLPARAGDVYKVSALLGRCHRDSKTEVGNVVGVVFAADKLADLAATISLAIVFAPVAIEEMTESERFIEFSRMYGPWVLALALALALGATLVGKLQGAVSIARQILETVFVKIPIPRYFLACALAAVSFLIECGALVLVVQEMAGVEIGLLSALWVMIIVNLGIAVPLTLANLGAFEAAMTFGLSRFGVSAEAGLAIAIVHHSIQVGSTIGMSLLCVSFNRIGRAGRSQPSA